MPTFDHIDAEIDALVKALAPVQEKIRRDVKRGGIGRCLQLLPTAPAAPEDGKAEAADVDAIATPAGETLRRVSDGLDAKGQPKTVVMREPHPTWESLGILPKKCLARYSCDCYEGPKGHGWVLNAETVVDGTTYRRAVNVGPETWREQEWREVVPPSFPK